MCKFGQKGAQPKWLNGKYIAVDDWFYWVINNVLVIETFIV